MFSRRGFLKGLGVGIGVCLSTVVTGVSMFGEFEHQREGYARTKDIFVVPDGVSKVEIKIWGAGGGGSNYSYKALRLPKGATAKNISGVGISIEFEDERPNGIWEVEVGK